MKVNKKQCTNCLMSERTIVSPEHQKSIIQECVTTGSHFICHHSKETEIACKGFYDTLGHTSNLIRGLQRMGGGIHFVKVKETEKYIAYNKI